MPSQPTPTPSPQSDSRQPSSPPTTGGPSAARHKTPPPPDPQATDGALLGKVVGLAILVLGGTEFVRDLLPPPWLPHALTILAGIMVTVMGVRLALQRRHPLLRQIAEGLSARKRLEEAQLTLLDRSKRGEQLHQELTQQLESLRHAEQALRTENATLTTQAQGDAAALARLGAALQTESVERTRGEQALTLTTTAVAEANRVKSEFLANISHELRTPLNGVIGMTKLLLDTPLTAEQYDYAESVRLSADLLHTVTNSLFDFSELEMGALTLEESDFELPRMIDGLTSLFADAARKKQIEFSSFLYDDAPVGFRGDAGRLRQVLLLLVGNALKFTETGAVSIQTNLLHQTATTATLRFSISDTGIGIPANRQAHLFQPFFQVDGSSTRRYGGSGIGLALAKKLVELMGGVIGVESTLGKGSLFWFTLPLGKQHLATVPTPARLVKQYATDSARPGATPRILVAEDNLVNQKLVTRVLEKLGYDVRLVFNGQEAVHAIEQGAYAAVLMDCQMPVMDGLTATETIRAWESAHQQRRTPIIALTAHLVAGDRERCLAVGMDDYLTKPLNPDKLAPTLKHWLQQLPPPEEAFLRVPPTTPASKGPIAAPVPAATKQSPPPAAREDLSSRVALDSPPAPVALSDPSPTTFSVDLGEALDRVDGDRELLGELAEIFLDSCPAYLDSIRQALAQNDAAALTFAAHALKGSVGNFVKIGPFETARALEALGRQSTLTGTSALFQQLENEIAALQLALANLRLAVAA
jgi:signal transduction histidine kinase/DNA-binding NarL/FixJ family response regulator/HPt (histidine-containing phosphotransfer) domain-containing protein